MPSIALIGPDGAGKTTICRMLAESGLLPFRYLYMGINTSASNYALPTTRLLDWIRQTGRKSATEGQAAFAPVQPAGAPKRSGALRGAAHLIHRLADEWYRQLVSWILQMRGYIVLYDRHFVFDFALDTSAGQQQEPFNKRLHRWFLDRFYPRPDLVICLEAPAALLFARKGEFTPEALEAKRKALVRQASRFRNFVRVDASRPLDEVYAEVAGLILEFCRPPLREAQMAEE